MSTYKNLLTACFAAVFALGLAACSSSSDSQAPAEPPPPAADAGIEDVRSDAMAAATAADAAADAAEAAVQAQGANQAAAPGSYAVADNAAERAREAADAAEAASDAAAAATTTAAAQAQLDIAQAKQAEAEGERDNAVMYANMVAAAQQALDDEAQRVLDVAAARGNAMQSYMDADSDATKAEAAADEAEADAPGSPGAIAARNAATAARTAANMAKAAHDAITDGMTKAQADAQAAEAATQAGNANTQYAAAKAANDAIQTAEATADENQRVSDIANATEAASDAATAARTAATAARTAATAARTAATAANAAYMRAVAARTDSNEAKTQADAAAAAAVAAEAAATAAEMAAAAAEAAHMGIDADGSAEDAKTAEMTAETQQGTAETQQGTAETQQGTAETAQGMAETSAGTHVLRLFLAANGAHVADDETTMDVDETAAHVTSVGAAMATIAAVANGAQAANTTASAAWPGDIAANPDATPPTEAVPGNLALTVNVNGDTEIVSEFRESRAATDLNNDGDTDDAGEAQIIQTAREIAGLGVFRGFEMWENDDDAATNTDRARVIVFANKTQDDPPVAQADAVTARSVVGETITTASELSNVRSSGRTITGVTWTPAGQAPLTGTLTCGDACDITLGEDGAVTDISGYTFTGSREASDAVTAMDAAAQAAANNDYLMFGLWLQESDDGATDTFGSFAAGGANYAVNVQNAVTGTATYSGSAAGAHHRTGDGVNWFHGDARLTANFGAADAAGSISGAISNIRVNGGAAMSTPIYLGQAALSDGTATFNGAAFMGAATAPGASTHEFDGTWSGSFFGATADDADTADVNESVTAPLAAAGTFGVTKSEGMGDDMVVESFVGAFGAHKD